MTTAICRARLFDGERVAAQEGYVLFDETGILALGEGEAPAAGRVIDAHGCTVTPGLIDCHVHLGLGAAEAESFAVVSAEARKAWRYGITTLRNCCTGSKADIAVRNLIRSGRVDGCRIVASGRGISITGGHVWRENYECDTVDEARKAARTILRDGADQVKLFATGGMGTKGSIPNVPQLTEAQMRAAVEEAEAVGALTCAHATGIEGAQNAIRAGVRSIEHVQMDDETARMMAEHGCFYCPTIVTRYNIIHCTDPAYQWMRAKAKPGDLERKRRALELCREHGIPVCAGTDGGTGVLTPLGSSLWDELCIYNEYGMTCAEALRAATQTAAKMLRLDDVTGALRPGLAADIAVFRGDPTENIQDVRRLDMTFQGGRLVYLDESHALR